jgi:Mg-chelatase subunit ChlD
VINKKMKNHFCATKKNAKAYAETKMPAQLKLIVREKMWHEMSDAKEYTLLVIVVVDASLQ